MCLICDIKDEQWSNNEVLSPELCNDCKHEIKDFFYIIMQEMDENDDKHITNYSICLEFIVHETVKIVILVNVKKYPCKTSEMIYKHHDRVFWN